MNLDRRQFLAESIAGAGSLFLAGKLPAPVAQDEDGEWDWGSKVRLWFIVAKADVPNSNGRIYPQAVLQKCVDDFNKANHKNLRSLVGELGQPADSIIHFTNASHLVTDLKLQDGNLMAEIEVIQTPNGKILSELLKADAVAFRPRGIGMAIATLLDGLAR